MLKHRKALYAGIAVVIGIALFFVVFQIIRKNTAKKQWVSGQSTSILKISVDDLMVDIVSNAIGNSTYYSNRESSSSMFESDWSAALYVPSSMYLFSIDERCETLYSYQKVKDDNVLMEAISNSLDLDSSAYERNGNQWSGSSKDGKIHFIGDGNHILIQLNYSSSENVVQLKEMWKDRAEIMKPVATLDAINSLDLKGDIVYANVATKDTYVLDFENGMIHAKAKIYSELVQANDHNKVLKMNPDAVLSAFINADISSIRNKYSSFVDSYPVIKNILNHCSAGYADILWKKEDVIQRDTIISYDYDDNFDMVEKEIEQEVEVPNWEIAIKGGTDLYVSLPDKMFYSFEKKIDNGYVILSTSDVNSNRTMLDSSVNFFELYYNYDVAVNRYLMYWPTLKKVKSITVKGRNVDHEYALIEGEVRLTNEHIHPLSQLF